MSENQRTSRSPPVHRRRGVAASCASRCESGWLTQGPKVRRVRSRRFAEVIGVAARVAVDLVHHRRCTSRWRRSASARATRSSSRRSPGWRPPTSCATAARRRSSCDVDRDTFNIDLERRRRLVSPAHRGVIPVHLFGLCADMDAVTRSPADAPVDRRGRRLRGGGGLPRPATPAAWGAAAFSLPSAQVDHHRRGRHGDDRRLASSPTAARRCATTAPACPRSSATRVAPYLASDYRRGRLQLPHDRSAGGDRHRPAPALDALSPSASAGRLVHRRSPTRMAAGAGGARRLRHGWQSYVLRRPRTSAPPSADETCACVHEQRHRRTPGRRTP